MSDFFRIVGVVVGACLGAGTAEGLRLGRRVVGDGDSVSLPGRRGDAADTFREPLPSSQGSFFDIMRGASFFVSGFEIAFAEASDAASALAAIIQTWYRGSSRAVAEVTIPGNDRKISLEVSKKV
jgi:hypothetical protein|tara:strand:+ start:7565 stop:7939 length:375 start_codon:yes stop_codon:yes gene_type:complete